jgi:predicted phosphodiesterase
MKLAFVGDVHGRVRHALAALHVAQDEYGAAFDAVFQVGDFGAFPTEAELPWIGVDADEPSAREFLDVLTGEAPAPTPLPSMVFLRGNHENAAWLRSLPLRDGLAHVDPHGLFKYAPDGTVLTVGTTRIGFLGGVERPDPASSPTPRSELIDEEAYERLWRMGPGRVDILLTHEPPTGVAPAPNGSPRIAALARRLSPSLHIGGHLHAAVEPVRANGTTYVGLSSLLRSPRFDPERAVQPASIAVFDTDSDQLRVIATPAMRAIRQDTLGRWLA